MAIIIFNGDELEAMLQMPAKQGEMTFAAEWRHLINSYRQRPEGTYGEFVLVTKPNLLRWCSANEQNKTVIGVGMLTHTCLDFCSYNVYGNLYDKLGFVWLVFSY